MKLHPRFPTFAAAIRRAALLMLIGLVAILLGGCREEPVAVVNGKKLTEAELAARTAAYTSQVSEQSVGLQVVASWIQATLIEEEARQRNLYPTEAEVSERLAGHRKRMEFAGRNWTEFLGNSGLTEEDIKRNIRSELAREKLFFEGVNVSEDEVRTAFEAQVSGFTIPAQARISQITVLSEADLRQVQEDLDGGASFELVATTYSQDVFREASGKVPDMLPREIGEGGPVRPEAVVAAFDLEPGTYSEPLQFGAAWVIVKLEEMQEAKTPTLDIFHDAVRGALLSQKAQQSGKAVEVQQRLAQLSGNASIEINKPQYKSFEGFLRQQLNAAAGGQIPPPAP